MDRIFKHLRSIALALTVMVSGCVTTSNYYSARTLESGKFSFTLGTDDIVLKSNNQTVQVSKDKPFTPSIGFAYGLPYRFETNVRYYPSRFVELTLRDQINPRDFELMDGSVNFTYAHLFGGYSYIKYGITISKNIFEFEPYIQYSLYNFMNAEQGDFSTGYISANIDDVINNNRSIGFGIGIPLRKAKLFPEVNYQYFGGDTKNGLWHFGVGIRVYTN